MPELPDLQVFSRNLNKQFAGKTLMKISVFKTTKVNASESDFKKSLEGVQLKEVTREGKELRFNFNNGQVMGLHLMLKGQMKFFTKTSQAGKQILEMLFDDESGLSVSDIMGAATPSLNPAPAKAPDALSKEIDFTLMKKLLSPKKEPVKSFLLDQKNIRGIGNAYADEILWDARISPFSVCNKIPDPEIRQLVKSVKTVLQEAEKQIMKSHPDIITGEIRDFLKVHAPGKTSTPTGEEILMKPLNSRKTYYTSGQKLFE